MKFTHIEQKEEDESDEQEHADQDQDIRAVFTIIQRPSFLLKGGEALITFEEKKGNAWNCIFFIAALNIVEQICRLFNHLLQLTVLIASVTICCCGTLPHIEFSVKF